MASETTLGISSRQGFFCLLVVSATAGFLGARRFAAASGIGPFHGGEQTAFEVFGGIAFGLLTFVALFLLAKVARAVVTVLAGAHARPPVAMAVTLVVCGTLCVVAALGLSLWDTTSSAGVSTSIQMQPGRGAAGVTLNTGGSLMFPFLTICVFLGGVAMIVVGIWGSLQTGHESRSMQANPEVASVVQRLDS